MTLVARGGGGGGFFPDFSIREIPRVNFTSLHLQPHLRQ